MHGEASTETGKEAVSQMHQPRPDASAHTVSIETATFSSSNERCPKGGDGDKEMENGIGRKKKRGSSAKKGLV